MLSQTVIASLFLAKNAMSAGGHWDYDHMDHWKDNYEMCGTLDQSPINVNDVVYDTSVCGSYLDWTVNTNIHQFKVSNNGHSIVLQPATRIDWAPDAENEGTITDELGREYTTLTTRANSIGRLQNNFLPEDSPHNEFCLHSFHFHWGLHDLEGSEHLVDDEAWPLEVHFVHYSCYRETLGGALGPYGSVEDVESAADAGEDVHELAVVGIFFDITDEDNPAFDVIFNDDIYDDIKYPGSTKTNLIDGLYLQDMIPSGVFTDGYYSYEGSLTTPPCTPIVRWHVSNARSYIGKNQMAKFREMMANANKTSAPNYREPQYNEHTVYACMEEVDDDETTSKPTTTKDATTTNDLCRPFCEDYYCGDKIEREWQGIVWFWSIVVAVLIFVFAAIIYFRYQKNNKDQPGVLSRSRIASSSVAEPQHGVQSNAARGKEYDGGVTHI